MSAVSTSRDWETVLKSWIKPASATEDAKREYTASEISAAIRASSIPASAVKIYAKGSYANNTNVRADSDVDIAVEWTDLFHYDLTGDVEGRSREEMGITPASGAYSGPTGAGQFKDAVENALVCQFGRAAVTRGNKALTVRESRRSLAADVVACFSYRRYFSLNPLGTPRFHEGTYLTPDRGGKVINWPQQHYDNGVTKNDATGRRFKRMVRVLKRLENEMVEKGVIAEVPSYLIECLVYNVPNEHFGHTRYVDDLRAVLAVIFNETMATGSAGEWIEVNALKWLFRGEQKWTPEQAHAFAGKAWDYVGFE